jgi:hypothetical protein
MWLSQAKYLIKLNLIMLSLDDIRFFCVQVGPTGAAAAGEGAGKKPPSSGGTCRSGERRRN